MTHTQREAGSLQKALDFIPDIVKDCDVYSKTEECRMNAIYTHWIGNYDFMENLVTYGETLLSIESAKARFKTAGIKLTPKIKILSVFLRA